MLIMGIDPGTLVTGYGIVEFAKNKFNPLAFGVIKTDSKNLLSSRYLQIFNSLNELIDKYKPEAISIEGQFMLKNFVSASKISQAKAMAVLTAAKNNIPIYEYQPKDIKQSVVGRGTASKDQVAHMVRVVLGLNAIPKPQDASDALATAICHCNNASNKTFRLKRI